MDFFVIAQAPAIECHVNVKMMSLCFQGWGIRNNVLALYCSSHNACAGRDVV
ncbi:hypothetical protein HMPREF1567_0604 [Providencia alcalifaciens PAL-2]|nr:hypothetical protein HMPREF1567_0604 [Providencia alcalifaciens PAL-2]